MKQISREYNPLTDAWETWYWDEDKQTMTIKSTFNIGDILEANKSAALRTLDTRYDNKMMHHVAEIPNALVVKFKKEHDLDIFDTSPETQKKLRKVLEMPEYKYLKTTVKKLWRPTTNG